MNPVFISHLKTLGIGALVAALGYIGVSLGADPVFNADPVMGAVVGFIITIIGRVVQALTTSKPAPEVVPLAASLDASAFLRQGSNFAPLPRPETVVTTAGPPK